MPHDATASRNGLDHGGKASQDFSSRHLPGQARLPSRWQRLCGVLLLGLLWLCVWPALGLPTKPLDGYFKEVWTTRDGLPHNLIHAIAQTPDGYLWFASWEGVVRYNGIDFRLFDQHAVPELRDSGVQVLRLARDGSLLLGTAGGGVVRYRAGRWSVWPGAEAMPQEQVIDLVEGREGELWVGTHSKGVLRIDSSGAITSFDVDAGLPSSAVLKMLQAPDGTVWVATTGGLARYSGGRFVAQGAAQGLPPGQAFCVIAGPDGRIHVGMEQGVWRQEGERFAPLALDMPPSNVTRMHMEADGTLWLGTVTGLYRHSPRYGLERIGTANGLPNEQISALWQDRENSLWVGTNGGLLRLRDAPFTTFGVQDGLPNAYVRSVLTDRSGTLWVATSDGLGWLRDGRFGAAGSGDGLPGESLLSLARARAGGIWVGSYSHGVVRWDGRVRRHLDSRSGLIGNQVRAVLETADGTLWVGTSRGLSRVDARGVRHYTVAQGMPNDFIVALHEDHHGVLWVGTSNGLARIEGEQVRAYPLDDFAATNVFGLHETDDGTLWLATNQGVIRRRGEDMRLIGVKQGLPVAKIFQVVEDGEGGFWLTSNRGMLRVARRDLDAVADGLQSDMEVEWFNEGDGLVSAQNNGNSGPAAWRAADGKLWFATAGGLAMTEPGRIHELTRIPPPVVIEEVRVDDRPVPLQAELRLPPGTRKLELHFAGLSYQIPKKIRYRYRLDGFDSDWVERGALRFAQFTNLAPGDYVFRVSAAHPSGGRDGEEVRIAVHIEPRLMQRLDFQLGLGVLALLALYGFYRWRVHALQVAKRQLVAQVEERTHDLRVQSEAFERQAREDALTGLMNRRAFDEALAREFASAMRDDTPLTLVIADLDHFKRINDAYSHIAGDAALRAVADTIRAHAGKRVPAARWGGEEFALLFPGLAREDVLANCERLRQAVAAIDTSGFAPGFSMSISMGVAERVGLTYHEKLINRADALLYEAKRGGRNRVCG
ncbi:ligand-binding sensor domain-containing diguanylate cyclase [Stenotrophomonas humi]|uniref:ligand-binding sensor domain-containing diguanylate cyclase n=1 Tax=Stenotrophomonas humi TaxID=405444 RepID=UPI000708DB42|nr:ligand-binding sensor domain-containing diguanylate cyclase [Stenotrophomonas humi]